MWAQNEGVSIDSVTPDVVSSCASQNGSMVGFLIKGRNLWRNPVVYLRGKKHESLSVLPDMNGLVATFDISRLPPKATAQDKLTVWSSFGEKDFEISIVNTVNNQPCGKGSLQSSQLNIATVESLDCTLKISLGSIMNE